MDRTIEYFPDHTYFETMLKLTRAHLNLLIFLAKCSVATAQFRLGYMYQYGIKVKGNDKEALYWFKQAAAQGHTHAQWSVGAHYHMGSGVERDDKIAKYYFTLAAKQGHQGAKSSLGMF